MEQPWRELAQRDAKVIRAGIATALVAILAGVVSLFAGPLVGGLAAAAASSSS